MIRSVLLLAFFGYWLSAARAQVVCTGPTGDPTHCICDTPDGTINVTGIGDPNKQAKYAYIKDAFGNMYDLNPCYGLNEDICYNAVACQDSSSDGEQYSLGDISTGGFYYDAETKEAYLLYTGGSDERTTQLELHCDESVAEDALVDTEGEDDSKKLYVFHIRHRCACPGVCAVEGGEGGESGIEVGIIGVALITLTIVCFIGYFVVGAIILSVKYQKTGTDIIPQKKFWMGLPVLVKDGVVFMFSPICSKSGKGDYQQLH